MNGIRQAFPQALILIPFRESLSHAGSLLRQHRNVVEMQAENRFVRSYMTWLVHHEFGHDHRPFRFGEDGPTRASSYGTDTIEYWLDMWCATYEWLERSVPEDAIFVCYEDLCSGPEVWSRLAKIAGITTYWEEYDTFRLCDVAVVAANDLDLTEQASDIYARLADRARAALR